MGQSREKTVRKPGRLKDDMNINFDDLSIEAGTDRASLSSLICRKAKDAFSSSSAFFIRTTGEGKLNIEAFTGKEPDKNIYEDYLMPIVETGVFENRAPLIVSDTSKDPRFLVRFTSELPGYSILSFPIIISDMVTGIVSLYRPPGKAFGSSSISRIQDFTNWAGQLLERGLQLETYRYNKQKLEILNRLTRTVSSVQELDKAAEFTGSIISEILGIDCRVFFFREDEDWNRLPQEVRKVLARGVPSVISREGRMERLVAPITYQELMPGYLEIEGLETTHFLDLARTISTLLGAAARRILLDEEIDSNRGKIEALEEIANYELSGVLSSSSELDTILDSTQELIIHLLRVERVNVMLYDGESKTLKVAKYWGIDDRPFGRETLAIGEGLAGHALETGKPQRKRQERDGIFVESPSSQEEVRSLLSYPMIVEGRKVGVINIGSIYHDRIFDDDEIRMVSLIASRAALAVENSYLAQEQKQLIKEKTTNNRKLQEKNRQLTERGRRLSEITRQLQQSLKATEKINTRLARLNLLSNRIIGSHKPQFIIDAALEFTEDLVPKHARVISLLTFTQEGGTDLVQMAKNVPGRYASFLRKFFNNLPKSLEQSLVVEKKSIILHDFRSHPDVEKLRLMQELRSFYCFPLFNNERTFGALILGSAKEQLLDDEDIEFVSAMVNQVALSLDNADKYSEMKRRSEMLSQLNRMTGEIIFFREKGNRMDPLVEMSCALMDQQFGTLLLYNRWGELEVNARYGRQDMFDEHLKNQEIRMIIEEVIRRNQIYYSSSDYEQLVKRYSLLTRTGIESMVIMPLISKGNPIGALLVGSDNPQVHTATVLEYFKLLASHLALTIDNALLISRILLEKDRIHSVFESMKEGVVSIDWERKITAFNRAAEETTGYSESEALGKFCYEIFRCKDDPGEKCVDVCPLMDMLSSATQEPGGSRTEGKFKKKDGTERDLSVTSSLLTQNGDPVGGVLVFRDITQEKAFQARRSDYLAAISHDIFTPLTAMKGYVTTLLLHQDRFDVNMQKEFMRVINSEIDRMTRLLYNLMSLSRMETDKLQAMPTPQNLEGLIQKIVDLYSLSARNHEIVIDETVAEMAAVYADPDQVEQILSNLVSNAIKYSPGGGKVEISAREEDGKVFVSVRDHGIGVEDKDLERIFDRYQRVITKKSRSVSGMGLGLFITKVLTEMQGGSIWAERCEDGGTRFVFTLRKYGPDIFDDEDDEDDED